MRKVKRKAVESTITQATSRIEATAPQPGSVAVESGELTPVDSVGAVCDGGTRTRLVTQDALACSPGRGPDLPSDDEKVDPLGVAAATEIISEDPAPLEDVDGEDGRMPRDEDAIEGESLQPTTRLTNSTERGSDVDLRYERLQKIARKIASQIERLAKAAKAGLRAKVELGLSLIEARELCCKRGEWTSLLRGHGLKPRTAEECIQFAKYRDLLEENAHGRAPLTTEEARKSIAAHRKAIGHSPQRRPSSRSNREPIGQRDRGLEIGDQGQPDQPGKDTTDAPDHEPVTVQSGPPAADVFDPALTTAPPQPSAQDRSGEEVAEADELSAPATVAHRSETGNHEGHQAPTPTELPDEEWLAGIPLRGQLSNPAFYDADAWFWAEARSTIEGLRRLADESASSRAIRESPAWTKMIFTGTVAKLLMIPHPRDWVLCPTCEGKVRTGQTQPCGTCGGAGYQYR
jgi:hypothetical protein